MSRQGMNRGVEPGTRIIPAVILGLSLTATISMVHAGAQERGQPPSTSIAPSPAPAARPAPQPGPSNVTPGVPMDPRAASVPAVVGPIITPEDHGPEGPPAACLPFAFSDHRNQPRSASCRR